MQTDEQAVDPSILTNEQLEFSFMQKVKTDASFAVLVGVIERALSAIERVERRVGMVEIAIKVKDDPVNQTDVASVPLSDALSEVV